MRCNAQKQRYVAFSWLAKRTVLSVQKPRGEPSTAFLTLSKFMTTNNHLCNLCGLTCKPPNPSFSEDQILGLVDCVVSGGYDSTPGNGEGALDDTMRYTFSLCEFCLDWLFIQFKIPVEVSDRPALAKFEPRKFDWICAIDRVTNDDWRKMKETFFKEFEKRNQARKIKDYI